LAPGREWTRPTRRPFFSDSRRAPGFSGRAAEPAAAAAAVAAAAAAADDDDDDDDG
jgi:hypothetical protein